MQELTSRETEILDALKELLKAGEHLGRCDNKDFDGNHLGGACMLHVAMSQRRQLQARNVVAKYEGWDQ